MDERKTLTPLSEALAKAQPISLNLEIPSIKLPPHSFEMPELSSIAKAIEPLNHVTLSTPPTVISFDRYNEALVALTPAMSEFSSKVKRIVNSSAVNNINTFVETFQKTTLKAISPSFDSLRKQLNDSVASAMSNYSLAIQKAIVPLLKETGEKMVLAYKQQLFQSLDMTTFRISIQENRKLFSQEIIDTTPTVDKEEQIPVSDDFYDAVEPIVILHDSQLDSCPLPEDVVATVKERPQWMTVERFLAIVAIIIALISFLDGKYSASTKEQQDMERHQEIVEYLGEIRDYFQDIDKVINEQSNSTDISPQIMDDTPKDDNGKKVTKTK